MAKTRRGWLILRGNTYHAAWKVSGRLFTKTTGESDKRRAKTRLAEIMRPFLVEDEARTLETVKAYIEGAQSELADIDRERNPPPTLERLWNRFLDHPSRPDSGENTLRQYASEWKRFCAWLGREHPQVTALADITPTMAAMYARDLTAAKVSPSTFNQHRNLLRMIWRVMADDCRLAVNPWDKITPRKLNALQTRKRAITPAQFEALLAAAAKDTDLRDLFLVLAWTGLRLVDAVMMKWGTVDFERRVISLAPQKTARRQGKMVHIPIFPALMDVLNRRQAGKPLDPRKHVFPALVAEYERYSGALSKRIGEAFVIAGMHTTEERSDRSRGVVAYGAHSLRHYFVTAATAAGMPAAMIKSITGHATDTMLEHYQQIGADIAADLAGRITGALTPALPPSRMIEAGVVRKIAEGMTARTWKICRDELMQMTGGGTPMK